MEDKLRPRLQGKVLIVGVGNVLRGDDGFGPLLIEALSGRVAAGLLDAGEVPESFLGRMTECNPDVVMIADAVHLAAEPGASALLELDELTSDGACTHRLPLALFLRLVRQQTGADVFLLGVQPGSTAFGAVMSREVQQTMNYLTGFISDCCGPLKEGKRQCARSHAV